MKLKKILTGLIIVCLFSLTSCNNAINKYQSVNENQKLSTTEELNLTVGEFVTFLETKEEHYPISDEFIEKYQQLSDGYIDLAKKSGIVVDRQLHSPNQKWHFFESWLKECLTEGTISYEDDAKKNVYTRLLCPELLLWIYEASGVEPSKVRNAMIAAAEGKTAGTHISTIAKNMRACVSWEDIAINVKNDVLPSSITLSQNNLELLIDDEATIKATVNPIGTSQKVTWSIAEGEDLISISEMGSELLIRAKNEGVAKIKASVNENIFTECIITISPNYDVNQESLITLGSHENALVKVDGIELNDTVKIKNGEIFNFTVDALSGFKVISVMANDEKLIENNGIYSFKVTKDTEIKVNCVDNSLPNSYLYNMSYDLGTRVTAKLFETTDQLFSSFVLSGEGVSLISSISDIEYIYGGANGGRGDTAWHTGNIIKFGTTSVNGSMTLELNMEVNYVKITGYVYDNGCKIQIGDSLSNDWAGINNDNKTTIFTCSTMNEVSKEIVEQNNTSTITITFEKTSSLTIATTNKKPLFITSIEFGYNSEL